MTTPQDSVASLPLPELDPLEPSTAVLPPRMDTVFRLTSPEAASNPCDTLLFVFGAEQIKTLWVPIGKTLLVGRDHPGNRRQPDLDLTQYDGLSKGISRLHATIQHSANGWWLTDLDSSNGSWLNRKRLAPSAPYLLGEVNEVRLGRLDFRIVVRGHGC